MPAQHKKRVIIVTDGDSQAQKAVEVAAMNVGGRCISASSGNPTTLTAEEIIDLVSQTPYDPVLVMVDDDGNQHQGRGERVLEKLLHSPEIEIIGALAVASATQRVQGITVDFSITRDGKITQAAVDKAGYERTDKDSTIYGDTVDTLNSRKIPVIIGIGDIGKMDHHDDYARGAPITTKAVQFILNQTINRQG